MFAVDAEDLIDDASESQEHWEQTALNVSQILRYRRPRPTAERNRLGHRIMHNGERTSLEAVEGAFDSLSYH